MNLLEKRKIVCIMFSDKNIDTAVSIFKEEKLPKDAYEIPGVTKVVLSPITQKAIGCVIGKDITMNDPCIYVNKNDMNLQSETSEFSQMKKAIEEYPEKNLLLVYDVKTLSEVHETEKFLLCVTKDAKDTMLNKLGQQNKDLQNLMKKYVEKSPRKWISLGSEVDIDDTLMKNFRRLHSLEFTTDWPMKIKKIKFTLNFSDKQNASYVEVKQGHIPIKNVYRKRIDVATQVAAQTNSSEAQTNPSYPRHTWTDYKYDLKTPDVIDPEKEQHIGNFINGVMPEINNHIRVNESINFFHRDYDNLVKTKYYKQNFPDQSHICFQDVFACKNKIVSAVAWHPVISGIIAAAYCTKSHTEIINTPADLLDETLETTYRRNLVLLWDYRDSQEPKLYLRAHREIKCINFCPYNPNIILAGCANGQIVIWDLTDQIAGEKIKLIETEKQQKHHFIMYSTMNWVKYVRDVPLIDPVVVSNIDFGYSASVTDISWLPSNFEIAPNRKVKPNDVNANLQFFTSTTNGVLYLWNINVDTANDSNTPQRQNTSKRLKEYPRALNKNISDFKIFTKILSPQMKFSISEALNKNVPISNILMREHFQEYLILNPETLDKPNQQTFFKLSMKTTSSFIPNFIVTTECGQILNCSLKKQIEDEEEIDPNEISEECHTSTFISIHDGPIRTCQRNPFIPELILTVGGKVFAIWDTSNNENAPLLWRRSKCRYLSGIWSSSEPQFVMIFRHDSHFETWDILDQNKNADFVIKYTGNIIVDGFGSSSENHVRKNTYCAVDNRGVIKIYDTPRNKDVENVEDLVKSTKELLEKQATLRKKLKDWTLSWKTKCIRKPVTKKDKHQTVWTKTSESKQDERHEQKELIKKLKFDNVDKQFAERWNEKEEKIMYKKILKKNKLDLQELEEEKQPLLQMAREKNYKKEKEISLISNKNKSFEKFNKLFFDEIKFKDKRSIVERISHSLHNTASYLKIYNDIERNVIDAVNSNKYEYTFNWLKMIHNSKSIQPVYKQYRIRNK